jgi:hypothetical protein
MPLFFPTVLHSLYVSLHIEQKPSESCHGCVDTFPPHQEHPELTFPMWVIYSLSVKKERAGTLFFLRCAI